MRNTTDVKKLADVTSDAVEKATGQTWNAWIEFLDQEEAGNMSHKEVTEILKDEGIANWWRQKIASGYRLHKGLRGKGQSDIMFQAGVSKTFDLSLENAWNFITAPETVEIWNQRNEYKGDLNVFEPRSHLRLYFQLAGWKKSAILQIRTMPKDERTTISLLLSGLATEEQRNQMKQHLTKVIDRLKDLSKNRRL